MAITRIETTQSDWQQGTLSNVVATAGGDLILGISTGNVALNKTYTKSKIPNASYPDTNNAEFTDGIEGSDYTDGKSFGYNYTDLGVADGGLGVLEITVDLGITMPINGAKLASGTGNTTRKYEADVLEILTSTDGATFTSRGSVGTLNTPTKYLTVSFPYVGARYVKFKIQKQLAHSGNLGDYLFIMEGYVYGGYVTSGTRTSPALDLSSVGVASSSQISWTASTPSGTSIVVKTSLDGGTTWQSATNGGAIPGMNLSGKSLLVRQTLSTTDPTVTPTLSDLTVTVGALQSASATAKGGATNTAHATWIGSVGAIAQASGTMIGRAALVASAAASTIAVATMDWNEHILAVSATAMAGATVDVAVIRLLIQTLMVNAIIQPGDIVEVDTSRMKVKINGVNALQYVEGDFFALLPGANYLEYQDSEAQRNVQIITRHRPRWL